MHLLIWILAVLCLLPWTLMAWALAVALGLDPGWVGEIEPWLEALPFGEQFEHWMPGWKGLVIAMLELVRALLGWAGSVGVWLVWVLWALGVVLVFGVAALLSLMLVLLRRTPEGPPAPPGSATA